MIKVSIIVPVYNVEKYLAKCLDSLVAQTLEEIEIIIVNDSSPDNSQELIECYLEQYPTKIKYFVKENGGIADVRNFGLRQITGEYFGFVDSDDYVEPTMYEKMYKQAKANDSDLVVSNFLWEYPNETIPYQDGPYKLGQEMLVKMMATLWNKLYRSEFVLNLPIEFPTGYRYEDAYFLYCMTPFVRKIAFVDESFVHYVQREGSITHQNDERVQDMIHVFEMLYQFYQEQNLLTEYQNELEYLFIRFFLGNSFLRTIQIPDKSERKRLVMKNYNFLNDLWPAWKKNPYLKQGGSKNLYFRIVSKWNINLLARLLRPRVMKKERSLYK